MENDRRQETTRIQIDAELDDRVQRRGIDHYYLIVGQSWDSEDPSYMAENYSFVVTKKIYGTRIPNEVEYVTNQGPGEGEIGGIMEIVPGQDSVMLIDLPDNDNGNYPESDVEKGIISSNMGEGIYSLVSQFEKIGFLIKNTDDTKEQIVRNDPEFREFSFSRYLGDELMNLSWHDYDFSIDGNDPTFPDTPRWIPPENRVTLRSSSLNDTMSAPVKRKRNRKTSSKKKLNSARRRPGRRPGRLPLLPREVDNLRLGEDIPMLDYFVIEERENIKNKLKTFMSHLEFQDSHLFIFDIHKTTLTKDGEINESVLQTITELLRYGYQVIFLSYVGRITGTPERIQETLSQINSEPTYRSIPKFFMKKRKKQIFMESLYELLLEEEIDIGMTLIDDNPKNIGDVNDLRDENFKAVHFTGEIDITRLL